eukprot:14086161-Heterocapsa_arctica.AAC.2
MTRADLCGHLGPLCGPRGHLGPFEPCAARAANPAAAGTLIRPERHTRPTLPIRLPLAPLRPERPTKPTRPSRPLPAPYSA